MHVLANEQMIDKHQNRVASQSPHDSHDNLGQPATCASMIACSPTHLSIAGLSIKIGLKAGLLPGLLAHRRELVRPGR